MYRVSSEDSVPKKRALYLLPLSHDVHTPSREVQMEVMRPKVQGLVHTWRWADAVLGCPQRRARTCSDLLKVGNGARKRSRARSFSSSLEMDVARTSDIFSDSPPCILSMCIGSDVSPPALLTDVAELYESLQILQYRNCGLSNPNLFQSSSAATLTDQPHCSYNEDEYDPTLSNSMGR
ncbi:hypothetical protein M422DRAFT_783943 [Sphaerobolus stellatus SS14]|uniref:Uncharacterized protein n=1 Tax=Sphaerobolus stellatus (strain SS14) TaxID=990650 RepID=A0A0C9UYW3_SPHS4|nr:hypothetical protein M422DRAFT_784099 [Sphaerobolus stellatus SS14]KIJ30611.1 hypothetical protein M422DRAFT_783943 [Sphaerobolus stellatus SS14]